MKFDVRHAAALDTVTSSNAAIDAMDSHTTTLTGRAETLTTALAASPVVAAAIAEVHGGVLRPTAESVISRARSASTGASEALDHYAAGDAEMRSIADSSSATVAPPDMPGGHG